MNFITRILETYNKGLLYDACVGRNNALNFAMADLQTEYGSLVNGYEELKEQYLKLSDELPEAKVLGFLEEDYYKSTQKDKPTNQTSISKERLKKTMEAFKKLGCIILEIQDTNSMEPYLDDSTPVACEILSDYVKGKKPLGVGHICIYESKSNGLIIHQIVMVRERSGKNEYRFRGINNFKADPYWVKESDIKYRVVAIGYASQDEKGD